MPKITSVERQKKNPQRFNIFIDGVFSFGSDEDLIVDHRLVVGKELLEEQIDKLLFEAEVGKLMERMYGLFNIRQRSEKEVRGYIKNLSFKRKVKGWDEISEDATELLIQKLKQKRMLDDLEFAKAWVLSRRKNKNKGKIALKQELFQKGIDREIMEQVIRVQVTGDSEMQNAQQALEKKLKPWRKLTRLEFKKKAYGFLLRKGFEYPVAQDTVEKELKKLYN